MKEEIKNLLGEAERINERASRGQTDESLQALANDLGMLTNPSLFLAASVAAELLRRRDWDKRVCALLKEKSNGKEITFFNCKVE